MIIAVQVLAFVWEKFLQTFAAPVRAGVFLRFPQGKFGHRQAPILMHRFHLIADAQFLQNEATLVAGREAFHEKRTDVPAEAILGDGGSHSAGDGELFVDGDGMAGFGKICASR